MIMEKKKLIQFIHNLNDDDLISVIFYSKNDVESRCDWDNVIEDVDCIIESIAGQVNQMIFESCEN